MAYSQAAVRVIEADIGPQADRIDPRTTRMADDHLDYVQRLFETYREPLMRYVTDLLSGPDDAEDIVQETYVRLLRAKDLDRSESRTRGYIFTIARNLAFDRFRHRKVEGYQVPYEDAGLSSSEPQPERIVDFEQGIEIVKQCLLELKPRSRQVFLMRTSEDLTFQQIGECLGIGKRTAEREMKNALDYCQSKLGVQQQL